MLYLAGFADPNATPAGFASVVYIIVPYNNVTPPGFTGVLDNKRIVLDYRFAELTLIENNCKTRRGDINIDRINYHMTNPAGVTLGKQLVMPGTFSQRFIHYLLKGRQI